jgi:Creatinase/Prolidase N-terminal domain.
VRYLTGLASSNAALLIAADGAAVLATDSRYTLAAQRDCPDVELITERFIEPRLAAEMASRALRTVAFEAHEMTVERHAELAAKAGGVKVVPFGRRSRSCGRSRIRPRSSCSGPHAGSPARPSPTCSR